MGDFHRRKHYLIDGSGRKSCLVGHTLFSFLPRHSHIDLKLGTKHEVIGTVSLHVWWSRQDVKAPKPSIIVIQSNNYALASPFESFIRIMYI